MKIISRNEYHIGNLKNFFGKDECPFCIKVLYDDYVLWRGKYFMIIHNKSPYSGNLDHIMAIPYIHKNYFLDLDDNEIGELKKVHQIVKEYFGDKNYFSFTRETMANRSVEHLHIHFLVGKLQGKFLRKMLELQGYPIKEDLSF